MIRKPDLQASIAETGYDHNEILITPVVDRMPIAWRVGNHSARPDFACFFTEVSGGIVILVMLRRSGVLFLGERNSFATALSGAR